MYRWAHPVGRRGLAHPSCARREAEGVGDSRRGTYLCMEGPQFLEPTPKHDLQDASAMQVIGMTNMPEAKLSPRG